MYATIDFVWNEKNKTLIINDQHGKYPGMIRKRTFNLILVKPNHGSAVEHTDPDKIISYIGAKKIVKL